MSHKLRKLSSKYVMERYRCTIKFCLLFHFVMLLSLVRNTEELNALYYHIFSRSNAMAVQTLLEKQIDHLNYGISTICTCKYILLMNIS